jgi:phenylpropionate dioxygenase-like ring-hydroxylating dioxygenase large terminal subunit
MKLFTTIFLFFYFCRTKSYYHFLKKIVDKPSRRIIDRLNFLRRKPNPTPIQIQTVRPPIEKVVKKREITNESMYDLYWYVIGETNDFKKNKLRQVSIWDKKYVVWRENYTHFYAMDNHCSHRGASLSLGDLTYTKTEKESRIICPYHGYEFNNQGTLCKIPGLNFTNTYCHNQQTYPIFEKDGWVYMNTIPKMFQPIEKNFTYREPEATDKSFSRIQLNKNFHAPARIVSENSLDVMHIGFVHTFGNKVNPSPIYEIPPFTPDVKNLLHYKTVYDYNAGKDSIAKKVFQFDKLVIENEFILPHTTVARVIFGEQVSTVITFALPQNDTHSKLFVKTYRNYWNTNDTSSIGEFANYLGDELTKSMMEKTVSQDKFVVENIEPEHMDGKYNMKYDKLQNVYRTMYKNLVKDISKMTK